MMRANAEDGPEEDVAMMAGGTAVEETASTFIFPSTLPLGPSDESQTAGLVAWLFS
jgi:hypothetical protein